MVVHGCFRFQSYSEVGFAKLDCNLICLLKSVNCGKSRTCLSWIQDMLKVKSNIVNNQERWNGLMMTLSIKVLNLQHAQKCCLGLCNYFVSCLIVTQYVDGVTGTLCSCLFVNKFSLWMYCFSWTSRYQESIVYRLFTNMHFI